MLNIRGFGRREGTSFAFGFDPHITGFELYTSSQKASATSIKKQQEVNFLDNIWTGFVQLIFSNKRRTRIRENLTLNRPETNIQ